MLKIVVYDSGYGGELFADQLGSFLPIVEIIRVIDWRNADKILNNPKSAREAALTALRPYIGEVDLIVFANYLLSATSLKFFQRKFRTQKFVGLGLNLPKAKYRDKTLILATKALTKTINFHNYLFHLKVKNKTMILDDWVSKIDDGELRFDEIRAKLIIFMEKENWHAKEIIIACSQFSDIKRELKKVLGRDTKVYDGNEEAIKSICKTLRIRGALRKKK